MMKRYFPEGEHMSYKSFSILLWSAVAIIAFLSSWSLFIASQVQDNSQRSQDAICALVEYFDTETQIAADSIPKLTNEKFQAVYVERIKSAEELVTTLTNLDIDCD